MSDRSAQLLIEDILTSAQKIQRYTAGMTFEQFTLDEKTADLNVRFRRGKTEAELDQKQGRVTIEQHLLDYAGIDRDIEATRAGKYWRVSAPESE